MRFSPLIFISISAIVLLTSPFLVRANGYVIEIPNPLKAETFEQLINSLIDFLVKIGLPIATIMIVWSGILFMASGGDPEKVTRAKKMLLYTVIGYGILLLSKGIISLIISILEKK